MIKDLQKELRRVALDFGPPAEGTIWLENRGKHLYEIENILKVIREGGSILDVGGGMGVNLLVLARMRPGLDLNLIDKFAEYEGENGSRMGSVRSGTDLMRKAGIKIESLDFLKDRLPYKDGQFDMITCFDVVEHVPQNPLALMGEIRRVLKPGGTFLLGAPNSLSLNKIIKLVAGRHPYAPFEEWMKAEYFGHYREYAAAEYEQLMKLGEFKDIKVALISEPSRTRMSTNPLFAFSYVLETMVPRLRPSVYCQGIK